MGHGRSPALGLDLAEALPGSFQNRRALATVRSEVGHPRERGQPPVRSLWQTDTVAINVTFDCDWTVCVSFLSSAQPPSRAVPVLWSSCWDCSPFEDHVFVRH